MGIVYLNTEEIVKLHEKIIGETGGHSGILSFGNLDFIVSQAKIPKDIERVAAILFFGILTGHPFVDGNKRTAYECLNIFLKSNNKIFSAREYDLWKVLHETSEGKIEFEKTVSWVKKNVR